jgi:hypothetical protein
MGVGVGPPSARLSQTLPEALVTVKLSKYMILELE